MAHVFADDLPDAPAVVCNAAGKVVWLNAAWTRLCGYTREEMMDRDLTILQGPATDKAAVRHLMQHVAQQQPCQTTLINYDRQGRPFEHALSIVPLQAPDGKPSLFRATSETVRKLDKASQRRAMPVEASANVDFASPHALGMSLGMSRSFDQLDLLDLDSYCAADAGECGGALSPYGASVPWSLPWSVAEGGMTVLTHSYPPFAIVWASEGWLDVCGFSSVEVVGGTLAMIQGAGTDRSSVQRLMDAVRERRACEGVSLVNYDKKRRPFRHTVSIEPVHSRTQKGVVMLRAESSAVMPLYCAHAQRVPPHGRPQPPPAGMLDLPAADDDADDEETEPEYWGEAMENYYRHWSVAHEYAVAEHAARH